FRGAEAWALKVVDLVPPRQPARNVMAGGPVVRGPVVSEVEDNLLVVCRIHGSCSRIAIPAGMRDGPSSIPAPSSLKGGAGPHLVENCLPFAWCHLDTAMHGRIQTFSGVLPTMSSGRLDRRMVGAVKQPSG